VNQKLLLCCDLDRTLLPNGAQSESSFARQLFRLVAELPVVTLAYVSGRSLSLLQDAITSYELPLPDYAAGDVGSTIYRIRNNKWEPMPAWSEQIAPDWRGYQNRDLADWCTGIPDLVLQEPAKQNTFKLSYYTGIDIDWRSLIATIDVRLRERDIKASIVWSLDEEAGVGLLDVLPENATKLHAIQFLMQQTDIPEPRTIFAGDSGNDLPVFVSGLQSVLVANATEETRLEAQTILRDQGLSDRLYVADGGFLGMNGNYAAGVLEGIAHFFPETLDWMRKVMNKNE
jgi:HAD superfamily hydrolase (TIGR01484 family)